MGEGNKRGQKLIIFQKDSKELFIAYLVIGGGGQTVTFRNCGRTYGSTTLYLLHNTYTYTTFSLYKDHLVILWTDQTKFLISNFKNSNIFWVRYKKAILTVLLIYSTLKCLMDGMRYVASVKVIFDRIQRRNESIVL